MNDRKMCTYVFESGYICGTTASVLADDNKWYCESHAKSIRRPTKRAPDACPYCAGKGEFVNVIGKALRWNHCAGTGQRR